jgi:predicted RNase H-like HicB family nuclease
MKSLEVLYESGNFVVAKRESRNYPGIFFQGDTIKSIYDELNEVSMNIKKLNNEEAIYGIDMLVEKFSDYLFLYENILKENGFDIPYSSMENKANPS